MTIWTFRRNYYTQEVAAESPQLAAKIDRALNASWKEGAVTQLMSGAFDYYLIPYALILGASTQDIGVLVSLPHFIAALSQLFAVRAVQLAGNRRYLLTKGTAIQGVFMIPLTLLPLLRGEGRIVALIILMMIFRVLANLIGPAWGSLMSDYLPERRRGEYFGWRSRLIGIVGVAGIGLWGILLTSLNPISSTSAFVSLFGLATVFRFASFYYMNSMVDLPLQHPPRVRMSLSQLFQRIRQSSFVRFLLFVAGITFGTQLSVAYFSVYLLQDLHFSYMEYMGVQLASATVMLLAYPLWGRQADITGNATILRLTGLFVPLIPLLWFLGRAPVHFMIAEAFAGFVWSGFNLCATNYLYDAVPAVRRVRVIGFYNLLNSLATFMGAWTGGWLAELLPPLRGSSILTLFLISAGVRFLATAFLARQVREVRVTARQVPGVRLMLSVLGVRPLAGRNIE